MVFLMHIMTFSLVKLILRLVALTRSIGTIFSLSFRSMECNYMKRRSPIVGSIYGSLSSTLPMSTTRRRMSYPVLSYLDQRSLDTSSHSSTQAFTTSLHCSKKVLPFGIPPKMKHSSPVPSYSYLAVMALVCSAQVISSDTAANMAVACIANFKVTENHEDPNTTQFFFYLTIMMSRVVYMAISVHTTS